MNCRYLYIYIIDLRIKPVQCTLYSVQSNIEVVHLN